MLQLVSPTVSVRVVVTDTIVFTLTTQSRTQRLARSLDPKCWICLSSYWTGKLDEQFEMATRWPKKKADRAGVSIFDLQGIMFPYNAGEQHWGLCLIINPGHIKNFETKKEEEACMLYLDSLGWRFSPKSRDLILKWLNEEWKSCHADQTAPFTKTTIPLYQPKGKSWTTSGFMVC